MYRRILLAADGSPSSLKAAETAATLARLTPDSSVTVFHVLHVPMVLLPAWDTPIDMTVRRGAREVIDQAVKAMSLPQEQVHAEVQMGDPAAEIVQMASTAPFDLIVMGSRGLSPVGEILLGGVSHRVASTATCPVLLVR